MRNIGICKCLLFLTIVHLCCHSANRNEAQLLLAPSAFWKWRGTDTDALRTRSTTEGTDRCTTPPKCLVHGTPPSKRASPLQFLLSILKPYAYFNSSFRVSAFQVISQTVVTVENPQKLEKLFLSCSATYIRMFCFSSPLVTTLTCLTALVSLVSSHTVITYPGWRGDNLKNSSDVETTNGLGVGANDTYPYGMQWIYPCTHQFPLTARLDSFN